MEISISFSVRRARVCYCWWRAEYYISYSGSVGFRQYFIIILTSSSLYSHCGSLFHISSPFLLTFFTILSVYYAYVALIYWLLTLSRKLHRIICFYFYIILEFLSSFSFLFFFGKDFVIIRRLFCIGFMLFFVSVAYPYLVLCICFKSTSCRCFLFKSFVFVMRLNFFPLYIIHKMVLYQTTVLYHILIYGITAVTQLHTHTHRQLGNWCRTTFISVLLSHCSKCY